MPQHMKMPRWRMCLRIHRLRNMHQVSYGSVNYSSCHMLYCFFNIVASIPSMQVLSFHQQMFLHRPLSYIVGEHATLACQRTIKMRRRSLSLMHKAVCVAKKPPLLPHGAAVLFTNERTHHCKSKIGLTSQRNQ